MNGNAEDPEKFRKSPLCQVWKPGVCKANVIVPHYGSNENANAFGQNNTTWLVVKIHCLIALQVMLINVNCLAVCPCIFYVVIIRAAVLRCTAWILRSLCRDVCTCVFVCMLARWNENPWPQSLEIWFTVCESLLIWGFKGHRSGPQSPLAWLLSNTRWRAFTIADISYWRGFESPQSACSSCWCYWYVHRVLPVDRF